MTFDATSSRRPSPSRARIAAGWLLGFAVPAVCAQDVELAGQARHLQTEARFTLRVAPDASFVLVIDGPIGERTGFDGRTLWNEDWNGATRHVSGWEREARLVEALVLAGVWKRAPAPMRVVRDEERPERVTIAFADEPVARLELDARGEVVRFEPLRGARRATWTFHPHESAERPHGTWIVRRGEPDDPASEDAFAIERVASVAHDPAVFAARDGLPEDVAFDAARPARVAFRRAATGHWLVRPELDERDVGWFLLDTGATHACLDARVADRLGYPAVGSFVARGVGGGAVTALRRGRELHLGPLQWSTPSYVAVDLEDLGRVLHEPLAGILGYDLFRRAVFVVDLAAGTLELRDPRDAHPEEVAWTPLAFVDRQPVVMAAFEGEHRGPFRLDTGDDGFATLHAPTVDALALLEGRTTRPAYRGGLYGAEPARRTTLAWLEVFGERRAEVDVFFSRARSGAFADPEVLGTLGLAALAGRVLVIDYPGRRMLVRAAD